MNRQTVLLLLSYFLIISGCAQQEQGSAQPDYDQTKKMVVDILKTDEGKKAIQEIITDEKVKQQLVMDQAIVKQTIEQTLTSEKGIKFWKKAFEDPKFVEGFAKSMQQEHEKMIKSLMKDPEYQAMMVEILQNPEMQKTMMNELKNKEFRGHLQKVMTETFSSPLFKAKIQDLLIKAAEDMQETKKKEGESGGEEGGGSEGGEGEGDQQE
ncbi:spore germination protein D [Thermolongibacillus altinsuensis]|jgi:spore germination protein D|uniref:Spore germination protein D n=1 Tax=Thermolongibacillus altinsuensis TaxID=575256 RepID=A0A4R1QAQ9_9BACL|nr:spore germination lipoprotein GerD [Thermolongibacillus altinsuensis]TCL46257.1 spore germination protein D [Thermolongibacillus altinsuensis]GMB10038.1 germination protein [Thermolongibacillus altinsuensis]